jgi:hypothetical protein
MKKPSRKAWLWTGAVLVTAWVMGTAHDFATGINDTAEQSVSQSPARGGGATPQSPSSGSIPSLSEPVRTIEHTRTVYIVPDACIDYLHRMDELLGVVYDYEQGIAPADQALTDAIKGLVDGSAPRINDARTRLNHIENDTASSIAQIVEAHQDADELRTQCQKAMEDK